jgi:hypothetical protein
VSAEHPWSQAFRPCPQQSLNRPEFHIQHLQSYSITCAIQRIRCVAETFLGSLPGWPILTFPPSGQRESQGSQIFADVVIPSLDSNISKSSHCKVACEECGKNDRGEEMLLCDGCDHGVHTDCLDPPMVDIPEGDWFCPSCATSKKPAAADGAAEAGPSSRQQQEMEESEEEVELGQPQSRRSRRRTLVALDTSSDEEEVADAAVTVCAPAVHIKAEPGRWVFSTCITFATFYALVRQCPIEQPERLTDCCLVICLVLELSFVLGGRGRWLTHGSCLAVAATKPNPPSAAAHGLQTRHAWH